VATLEALRALGVRVVIDDFGTGYFSLSHLRQFPVDALKIAAEFVQGAEGDARSAALAGAIVALAESLDITTVAEGIETEEQAERMRVLGSTYGQGWFFSRPVDATEVEAGMDGLATPHRWSARSTRPKRARRRTALRPAIDGSAAQVARAIG
jgi:EAL domain-containing protein (putative c-di-GMP-specific phosphodiesterase class I)